MKKLEKTSGIIIVLAILMKLFLIPGGGILFILSFVTVSIIYYLFGFAFFNEIKFRKAFSKESYNNITKLCESRVKKLR